MRRERVVEPVDTVYTRSEPPTTIYRGTSPTTYIQTPNSRSTRIVEVRQPPSPVIVDVSTPPLTTTTKTTRIINDNTQDTFIDDRRTLVNYQDERYTTRRTGRRSEWCGACGADCCACNCFDDCCGATSCCRTNSFARRKDVVSHGTRVTKDGRRVRYRVSSTNEILFHFQWTSWVFVESFAFARSLIVFLVSSAVCQRNVYRLFRYVCVCSSTPTLMSHQCVIIEPIALHTLSVIPCFVLECGCSWLSLLQLLHRLVFSRLPVLFVSRMVLRMSLLAVALLSHSTTARPSRSVHWPAHPAAW